MDACLQKAGGLMTVAAPRPTGGETMRGIVAYLHWDSQPLPFSYRNDGPEAELALVFE